MKGASLFSLPIFFHPFSRCHILNSLNFINLLTNLNTGTKVKKKKDGISSSEILRTCFLKKILKLQKGIKIYLQLSRKDEYIPKSPLIQNIILQE